MSQSDNGNRKRKSSGGKPPHIRSGQASESGHARGSWRDLVPGDEERAERGGPRSGQGRAAVQSRRGSRDEPAPRGGRRPERPAEPTLEYLLVQPNDALSAEITADPAPLRWRQVPDISLLGPGLYLRYRGSLQLVARELIFSDAVLYVLWDDEHMQYRTRDGWASPGLRAGFLVRTPFADNEGPPWIPIDAAIPDSIDEWDSGLLSSHLDPVHCTMFRAKLIAGQHGLQVSADAVREHARDEADAALLETITWLARNPESDHPAAVTARTMLVGQGHGLQRAGIASMSKDDADAQALVRDVLQVLAPEVAPVLHAVQALWMASDTEQESKFIELSSVLSPLLHERSPLQQPAQLAVLTTWLTGIFGSRPDRERRRPARSLFAALRLLRRWRGDAAALTHADVELPTFPMSRELSDDITRELSFFPQGETDLERVVRALAVGESSRDFARPTLDHLRPFAVSYHRVRGYPIATRTLLGRYDGISTMWSFRGRELDDGAVPVPVLESNLVLDTTTWASVRAYARVLGANSALSPVLAAALALRPERGAEHHPDLVRIATLQGMSLEDVAEAQARATRARRPSGSRVLDAIAGHEFLVSRLSRDGSALESWAPVEPEWAGGDDCAVRRHFMYWRTYCRSVLPRAQAAYGAFLERVVPVLGDLPWKLENEALALLRIWSRTADASAVAAFGGPLQERLASILCADDTTARDERVLSILSVLAATSWEQWESGVRGVLALPSWAEAEWHRILEQPRQNDLGDAFVESELFVDLHARFAESDAVGAANGRVEWLRQSMWRGRRAQSVRWMLHRESWPEVVFSAAFAQWFADRGMEALRNPDVAVVEVLELAAGLMTPETVDIAMHHLAERTLWPTREKARMLLDAGRPMSAVAWLSTTSDVGEEELNRALVEGLPVAKSAKELRQLAILLALGGARKIAVSDVTSNAVRAAIAAHTLPDADRVSLVALADAWRLANVPLEGEGAASILRNAVQCLADTGDQGCRIFLGWAVEKSVLDELRDDVASALASPAAAELLPAALAEIVWPEAFKKALSTVIRIPRRSPAYRAVWSALRSASESYGLEGVVDAAVLAELSRSDADAVSRIRESLISMDETLKSLKEDQNSSVEDETNDARTEASLTEGEGTEESSEQGEARVTAAERLGLQLSGIVRNDVVSRLRSAIQFWREALVDCESADVEAISPSIRASLALHVPLRLSLRESVLARVSAQALVRSVRVHDPRTVVANPMIRMGVDASPLAVEAVIEWVFDASSSDAETVKATVTRDSLVVSSRRTDVEEVFGDADASEASAIDDSEHQEPTGDSSEEASTDAVDDDAQRSEELSEELPAVVRAWRGQATAEEMREIFGSALVVGLIRRILRRNSELNVSVSETISRDFSVRWGRPRRPTRRRG